MQISKDTYIQNAIDHDYVIKSSHGAQAFLYICLLLFAVNLYLEKLFFQYELIFIVLMALLALYRISIARKYERTLENLEYYSKLNSFFALTNALLWSIVTILLIGNKYELKTPLFVTIFILISGSGMSTINLAHKKWVLFFFSIIFTSPLLYITYQNFISSSEMYYSWIIIFGFFSLVYSNQQGAYIRKDMRQRFSTEYDLKASYRAIQRNRKKLEEETIKTFHASRLSSLGEMAGGIAHEVNNPLMVIMGHITLLKKIFANKNVLNEAELRDSNIRIEKMNRSAQKISAIIKGMKLISSNHDQIEKEELNLKQIFDQSFALYEEKIKFHNVQFKLENETDKTVIANPVHISQILVNLISNAFDAVKNEEIKIINIKICEYTSANLICLKVINNGPLINDNELTKIFEPFFTTKALHEGTGLGLSISRSLARENEGELFYSEVDNMVCFNLTLKAFKA